MRTGGNAYEKLYYGHLRTPIYCPVVSAVCEWQRSYEVKQNKMTKNLKYKYIAVPVFVMAAGGHLQVGRLRAPSELFMPAMPRCRSTAQLHSLAA